MNDNKVSSFSYLVIIATFFIATLLSIYPLPYTLNILRPDFPSLTLIYWFLFMPSHIGFMFACCYGAALDVLTMNIVGITSLKFIFTGLLVVKFSNRLRIINFNQNVLFMLLILGLVKLIDIWYHYTIDNLTNSLLHICSLLISILVWPIILNWLSITRRMISDSFSLL